MVKTHFPILVKKKKNKKGQFSKTIIKTKTPKFILTLWANNHIPGHLWHLFQLSEYLCPHRASLVAQLVKNPPAMWEAWVWSLGWEDPLEKGKATHSSIQPWRIPWTAETMGLQRVRLDWATFTHKLCPHKYICMIWNCNFFLIVKRWNDLNGLQHVRVKPTVIHPHHGLLLSSRKEQTLHRRNNLNRPEKHMIPFI